ncbi:hypothetical protein BSM4216_3143 [Bacillus smithii]|nr:hypothetical protein BSM4216_3143 [Bacillus smithii]
MGAFLNKIDQRAKRIWERQTAVYGHSLKISSAFFMIL